MSGVGINSHSQIGQDIWVAEKIFKGEKGCYFADIGAFDGVEYSNTYALEKELGWNGVCVEASDTYFSDLKNSRSADCVKSLVDAESRKLVFLDGGGMLSRPFDRTGSGLSAYFRYRSECRKHLKAAQSSGKKVSLVKKRTRTLPEIFSQIKAPEFIHYLSLDIEGFERRILEKFPYDRYTFGCISAELKIFNLKERDEFIGMMEKNSYLLDAMFFTDMFFVHSSLKDRMAGQQWFDNELTRRIDPRFLKKPELQHIPWIIRDVYGEGTDQYAVFRKLDPELSDEPLDKAEFRTLLEQMRLSRT